MKPIIGITTDSKTQYSTEQVFQNRAYADAIEGAGGIPLFFAPLRNNTSDILNILKKLDGVLLAGGRDLPKSITLDTNTYPNYLPTSEDRAKCDMLLATTLIKQNIPVLGICLGLQELAVAHAATLIGNIPVGMPYLDHRKTKNNEDSTHSITITKGSRIADILGSDPLIVNSAHHQAIDTPPKDWIISSRADDTIIETIEHPKNNFAIAVQWHPERMLHSERHRRLFCEFIRACK